MTKVGKPRGLAKAGSDDDLENNHRTVGVSDHHSGKKVRLKRTPPTYGQTVYKWRTDAVFSRTEK